MHIIETSIKILRQLREMMEALPENGFSQPLKTLNQASIGQHVRHILEFYNLLAEGYRSGHLSYDQRKHDQKMETNLQEAFRVMEKIEMFLKEKPGDRPLILSGTYGMEETPAYNLNTTVFRELIYNIEHSVHHMAIIKIGIQENFAHAVLPHDFGIADSTLRYRQLNR